MPEITDEELNQLQSLKTQNKELNEKIYDYESRIQTLQKEKNELIANNGEMAKNVSGLTTSFNDLSSMCNENNKLIKEKINKIEDLMNQKEEMSNKITNLENDVTFYKKRIKDLKKKIREEGEGLLGHSMEIESLRKKVEEKEEEVNRVMGVLEEVKGELGILVDLNALIEYVKEEFENITRSLRMVIPNLDFLEENGILPLIKELNEFVLVNIAAPVDLNKDKEIVDILKKKGVHITNTSENSIFGFSFNSADVALGYIDGEKTRGFRTTIPEMIKILNNSIMAPFLTGNKI